MDDIKRECDRLAKLVYGDAATPVLCDADHDAGRVEVHVNFDADDCLESSCGDMVIVIEHNELAQQATLAALRVMAGEPDPRDAEIEALKAQLAEWDDARCQGKGESSDDWLEMHALGFESEGVPLAMNHAQIVRYQLGLLGEKVAEADAEAARLQGQVENARGVAAKLRSDAAEMRDEADDMGSFRKAEPLHDHARALAIAADAIDAALNAPLASTADREREAEIAALKEQLKAAQACIHDLRSVRGVGGG